MFYIFFIFADTLKMSGRINYRLLTVVTISGNKIKKEVEDRLEGFYFYFIYLALTDFLLQAYIIFLIKF